MTSPLTPRIAKMSVSWVESYSAAKLAGSRFVVLAVSVDVNERLYKQFLQSYKITFDTWRDPDSEIASRYGTFEFPETYIIDSSGRVVEKIISNKDWTEPEFVAHIQKMLRGA